jgi:hypothetical protein
MIIGICSLLVAIFVAFGKIFRLSSFKHALRLDTVIRVILVRENRQMDREDELTFNEAKRDRIELAAKLKGITVEAAMEEQSRFRYLY